MACIAAIPFVLSLPASFYSSVYAAILAGSALIPSGIAAGLGLYCMIRFPSRRMTITAVFATLLCAAVVHRLVTLTVSLPIDRG
jgi:hypothetical protein